jgi:hypothetical protein
MANIKESNYWLIKDFAIHNNRKEMQGIKLNALYNLVQKKGEPMKTDDANLSGVKVLEFAKGEYIGFKRTGGKTFFPCAIKTILLTSLN